MRDIQRDRLQFPPGAACPAPCCSGMPGSRSPRGLGMLQGMLAPPEHTVRGGCHLPSCPGAPCPLGHRGRYINN